MRRENSSRTPWKNPGSRSDSSWSSVHAFDSLSPCRIHQVTKATTKRWAKISRLPSRPSGTTRIASAKPTIGPIDQASCAVPTCRARPFAGASSAMNVHEAGTPAPTASPVITKAASSIP